MLVVRRSACRAFLQLLRTRATTAPDRLFLVLRLAREDEHRHRATRDASSTRLSRKLHPDDLAARHGPEQEWSLQKTSQLNDAYRTLKDPISRTEYLLKLEGVQLEEQSKSATDTARGLAAAKKQVVPPELLEEVFELNMQLEEARMNKKMGEPDPNLASRLPAPGRNLEAKYDALMSELNGYWDEWDAIVDRQSPARTTS